MSLQETEAIVLKRKDFGDTSLLVTFYTRDFGKIKTIAKGARSAPRKFGESLLPFTRDYLEFYLRSGKDLYLIKRCEVLYSFPRIREDLLKTSYVHYFVELIDQMVKGEEKDISLYRLLYRALYLLEEREEVEVLARGFEAHLLRILGYQPFLQYCVSCRGAVFNPRFSALLGGILCPKCQFKDVGSISISRGVLSAARYLQRMDLGKIFRLKFHPSLGKELEGLFRFYLTFLIGGKIKSLAFIDHLRGTTYSLKLVEGGNLRQK